MIDYYSIEILFFFSSEAKRQKLFFFLLLYRLFFFSIQKKKMDSQTLSICLFCRNQSSQQRPLTVSPCGNPDHFFHTACFADAARARYVDVVSAENGTGKLKCPTCHVTLEFQATPADERQFWSSLKTACLSVGEQLEKWRIAGVYVLYLVAEFIFSCMAHIIFSISHDSLPVLPMLGLLVAYGLEWIPLPRKIFDLPRVRLFPIAENHVTSMYMAESHEVISFIRCLIYTVMHFTALVIFVLAWITSDHSAVSVFWMSLDTFLLFFWLWNLKNHFFLHWGRINSSITPRR